MKIKLYPIDTLIALILLFSFFNSFAIVNFAIGDGFGLQFSWALCLVFIFYMVIRVVNKSRIKTSFWFKSSISKILICMVLVSVIDYIYLLLFGGEYIDSGTGYVLVGSLLERMIPHVIYIVFLFVAAFSLYVYLYRWPKEKIIYFIRKYFVTIPYIFIAFWGFIQWLSTFDIIEYPMIFNNNAATGFTYLRFKAEHRCSSVFPEPSEYAYYLSFLMPIVFSYVFGGVNLFSLKKTKINKCFVLVLYIWQCLVTQSFSLYMIFPVILLITGNSIFDNGRRKVFFNVVYVLFVIAVAGMIFLIAGDRVIAVLNGTDSSMLIRLQVFWVGLEYAKVNVFTGIGYGTFRAMDLISGTIAYFGILGTIYLIFRVFKLGKKSKKDNMSRLLYIGFLCMLIVACVSNSIYEILPFWLIPMFIDLLSEKRAVQENVESSSNNYNVLS